ncbi:ABC transporter ATP-binding protein [Agrobacterium sp. NPDC089420]|uniref:ABC transporter ATP-binding protein n=1 Tax=Agrobacterium sp. NPDC089420 TaxID=3363918 RepID=UPI0038504C70
MNWRLYSLVFQPRRTISRGAEVWLLNVRALRKTYARGDVFVPVLEGVSFSLQAGGFCALTGASGSGKTTLMNLIGLLDRPTSGEIEIAGGSIAGGSIAALSVNDAAHFRNRMLGYVFQAFHLLPRMTALDNVALPLLYRGVGRSERRELAGV